HGRPRRRRTRRRAARATARIWSRPLSPCRRARLAPTTSAAGRRAWSAPRHELAERSGGARRCAPQAPPQSGRAPASSVRLTRRARTRRDRRRENCAAPARPAAAAADSTCKRGKAHGVRTSAVSRRAMRTWRSSLSSSFLFDPRPTASLAASRRRASVAPPSFTAAEAKRCAPPRLKNAERQEALIVFLQNLLDSPHSAFMWGLCRFDRSIRTDRGGFAFRGAGLPASRVLISGWGG